MSILYRLFFARRWWLLLLPVVVCLGLAAIDSRFAYVTLIVAMAMVMISLPILYYYALTPESRWSILEKTATITSAGLQLDFSSEKMQQHVIPWSDIAVLGEDTILVRCAPPEKEPRAEKGGLFSF